MYKDCPNDIICNFCSEAGHKQKDCERYRASQVYGEYAYDITEDQTADLDQSTGSVSHDEPLENIRRNLDSQMVHVVMTHENKMATDSHFISKETSDMTHTDNLTHENNTDEKNQNKTDETKVNQADDDIPNSKTSTETTIELLSKQRVFLVIGDSNHQRVHFKDPDVKNVSVPGGAAMNIDELLAKAEAEAEEKQVKRIAVHLGANNISKTHSNQVILEITTAVNKLLEKFPSSEIVFSSIPNRRGNSPIITTSNKTTKVVNEFCLKMAKKESYLYFLNNDEDLLKDGIPLKSMYDNNDAKGVHMSAKGVSVLEEIIHSFFDSGSASGFDFDTPLGRKRNRSVMSNTPPPISSRIKPRS